MINPKNILYGKKLLELANKADFLSQKYKVEVLFTSPPTDLAKIVEFCPHLKVTAQQMDRNNLGDTMGKVLAESLAEIGAQAIVLNHADNPLTISELLNCLDRSKEVGLKTIVCADSIREARMIATLEPDIILAEPTELIGKNQKSSREYVQKTVDSIKTVSPGILVEQGAGIRTEQDVIELLKLGADGVGVTSGILKSQNPEYMMEKMIKAVSEFKKEGGY